MSVVNTPEIADNELDIEVTDAQATGNHKKIKTMDDTVYKAFMERNGLAKPQGLKLKWSDFKKTLTVNEDGVVVTADGEVVNFLKAAQEDRKFEVK
ncbi:hypothetical protein [Paenibacillus sp. 276b]|uniref:hypothetical protein n=1 Tax=Paenibacillus sp. 276b TaxID=1566277 RepID=UPI00089C4D30|nr:hypothetical protein [Paenibacillus sp. 276b]SEA78688.1 hypothetical protein SAMN03159332_2556 [Paenibacillus sp. 276b]